MENLKVKGALLEKVKASTSDDFQYIRLLNVLEKANAYLRQLGVVVDVVDIATDVQTVRFSIFTLFVDCDREVANALEMRLINIQKFTKPVAELYQVEVAE